MEWMRYLTLDQALVLLSIEFDFEKHLTLDQVYFILLKEKVLFIVLILSCQLTCKENNKGNINYMILYVHGNRGYFTHNGGIQQFIAQKLIKWQGERSSTFMIIIHAFKVSLKLKNKSFMQQ